MITIQLPEWLTLIVAMVAIVKIFHIIVGIYRVSMSIKAEHLRRYAQRLRDKIAALKDSV